MFPTSDDTNPHGRVEVESAFPSEINDTRPPRKDTPPAGADRTTPTLPQPASEIPITFESVPIGSLKVAGDSFEPRRRKSSGEIARLRRRIRAWKHSAAAAILPMFPGGVESLRSGILWAFAVGVLSGIVVVSALRSDDPPTKISAGPQVSEPPVVASAFPQLPIDDIGDDAPTAPLPAPRVETPAPQPVPQKTKPRRVVSGPQFRGHLIIDSEPRGATVMINQRLVGTTPLELSRYPASSYAVRVQQDGYQRWSAGVLVPADKVTRVHARLQRIP